jgi:hypothetical protein
MNSLLGSHVRSNAILKELCGERREALSACKTHDTHAARASSDLAQLGRVQRSLWQPLLQCRADHSDLVAVRMPKSLLQLQVNKSDYRIVALVLAKNTVLSGSAIDV